MVLFDFTNPIALLLLLLLIPVVLWHRSSMADMPSIRRKILLVLRILIIVLLIFALAGLRLKLPKNELSVVFVVDASLSVSADNQEWARDYIREQIAKLPQGDSAGVVLFGKDAYIEENLSHNPRIARFSTVISPQYTDIANAVQLASAIFPESSIKRIVLISDGNENIGNVEQQAIMAAARGIEIRCLPYPQRKFSEALISELDSPKTAALGEPFALKIQVESFKDTKGIINIFRNNELVARENVDILEGKNVFVITQSINTPGNYHFKASVEITDDRFQHNNQAETFTTVEGYPRILYICENASKTSIPQLLKDHKFNVEVGELKDLPSNLAEMANYQAVIFDNVNGIALSPYQLQMVQNYVKDLGGGFIMIGGDSSFGAGGYYKTPIEEVLPVDLDIRKKKNLPTIALVLVIDKSGSMGASTGGVEKLKLAREAAIATADLLGPDDKLGVIEFDEASKWVVPIQYVRDKNAIFDMIASIRVGGGTSMYPALSDANSALASTQAMIKHVIALTDGRSAPGDFKGIVAEMLKNKITLSTIGVGNDADTPFLENLAKWGQGRFYYTDSPTMLPRIFVKESILAGRAAFIEEPFIPTIVGTADFLKGINLEDMPKLYGYVVTTPKDGAQLVLQTHQKDPLLAYWRIGLGKSIAFTSDDGLRWGKDWAKWDKFDQFWSQAVRWSLPLIKSDRYSVSLQTLASEGKIAVEAMDEEGKLLNFLPLTVRIVSPSGKTSNIALRQTASGRYEGNFEAGEIGTYFATIIEEVDGKPTLGKLQTFCIPYSPEFKKFETNTYLLQRVSSLTGGKILSPTDDIFDKGLKKVYYPRPAWMELLLIALFLFPFDVAIRRVYLPEGFYENLSQLFSEKKVSKKITVTASVDALKKKKVQLKDKLSGDGEGAASVFRLKKKGTIADQQISSFSTYASTPAPKESLTITPVDTAISDASSIASPAPKSFDGIRTDTKGFTLMKGIKQEIKAVDKAKLEQEEKTTAEGTDTLGRLKKLKKDFKRGCDK